MVENIPLPEDLNVKVRELETEIRELREQVDLLTKQAREHAEYSSLAVGHAVEGMSILRYYANSREVRLEDLEGAFDSISELQHICEACNFLDIRDELGNYTAHIMSCIIELCGKTRITSPELLQTLEEQFDRTTLQTIVDMRDVAESYGLAEAHVWWQRFNDTR